MEAPLIQDETHRKNKAKLRENGKIVTIEISQNTALEQGSLGSSLERRGLDVVKGLRKVA